MKNVELVTFSSPEELARSVAAAWLEKLRYLTAPQCVALDGGRVAGLFFTEVARICKEGFKPAVPVHFFWGDERCVQPEDPDSNFRLANERMLKPLRVPPAQIHRIRGEQPPQMAALEAEGELRRFAPPGPNGQPVLDLVFLGMGEEGHTASLFPGEPPELRSSPAVFRPVVASKPPPHRITLGYQALAAAREAWLLASGSGKEQALRRALAGHQDTPLGYLLAMRSHTRVFTDLLKK